MLVTVDILDRLLQLQELHETSSLNDPPLGVSCHEPEAFEGAEMNSFSKDTIIIPRFAPAFWSVQYHQLWV